MAPTVPVVTDSDGRFRTLRTQADALALDLEATGAAVDQALAVVEHERWLQLIRAVGTGAPPHPSLTYSGGDVCDAHDDGTNIAWLLSDFFDNLTVNPDDTYGSNPIGPTRNGVILQNKATGAFAQQLGGVGTAWIRAVENGGLPLGLWWPLTQVPTAGVQQWIGCWYNDAAITPNNPFGAYLDTHLVQVAFGAYQTHVACGFTDQKFFIECARLSGSTIFTLGGEFHPRIDQVLTSGTWPGYAMGGNLVEAQAQLDLTHRLSRAAQAAYGTVSSWEYWTGTGWSNDRSQAIELRDTTGELINGAAGFAEVEPGRWVLAAHQLVDTHVDVYHAAAPQGPWARHARVPINPPVGTPLDGHGDRYQIAWHTKVHTHYTTPPGRSIVSLTTFPQLPGLPFTEHHINLHGPLFVVVPWE